jgi:hypothetical protein
MTVRAFVRALNPAHVGAAVIVTLGAVGIVFVGEEEFVASRDAAVVSPPGSVHPAVPALVERSVSEATVDPGDSGEVPADTSPPSSAATATAATVPVSGPVASGTTPAVRGTAVQVTDTMPPPVSTPPLVPSRDRWGTAGSEISGRCTQFEALLTDLAPPGGWDVPRMSSYMARESMCCPQVRLGDGSWRTTQGGDRFTDDCGFLRVAVWHHRSDAGLLQINGINYDPSRCLNTCLGVWLDTVVDVDTLGDPVLNVRAAARLCEFWVNAGHSCYQPWKKTSS